MSTDLNQPLLSTADDSSINSWMQAFNTVLSEEDSLSYFTDALRQQIKTDPMAVFEKYVFTLHRISKHRDCLSKVTSNVQTNFDDLIGLLEKTVPET